MLTTIIIVTIVFIVLSFFALAHDTVLGLWKIVAYGNEFNMDPEKIIAYSH